MRIKPKKRLGQNFLADANIRRKLVSAMDLSPDDTVLEIGPGKGELTALIAATVKRLIAVEIDASLIPVAREACAGLMNVEIVHADFLKYDLSAVCGRRLKVIGNIPYYISTPIIEKLIECRHCVSTAWLTVQREFAERVIASAGTKAYGSLTCYVGYYADAEIRFRIPAGCFLPVPKVDSAFLQLRFRQTPLLEPAIEKAMFRVIRAAFNQRRKTLRRSLALIAEPKKIAAFLSARGLDQNARPEQLALADFAALTAALAHS